LISHFVRRQPSRLCRWGLLDGPERYGRLVGFQDDLFRPFARRLDPDDRSIDDELLREHRRRHWQTPVGGQQQSRKRGSDEGKVTGYGQCLSLQQIEQWRPVYDRDIRHGQAHCTQTCCDHSRNNMHRTVGLGLYQDART
jgi:hypothetical protein